MVEQQVVQRVAMKAVIVRDGKLLMLREASTYEDGTHPGRYHFPGGRINPGEPFMDGLKREVLEETGLDCVPGQPLFVGEWFPVIKGKPNHIVAVFIVCETSGQDIVLSDEHDDFQWVDLAALEKLDVVPPDDTVVGRYFMLNSK